jgi:hypothetical protein
MAQYTFPYAPSDMESFANEKTARFRKGGALALRLSRLAEPTGLEACTMLHEVWKASGLPIATIAALLGASYPAAESWLHRRRMPTRAARRTIWLLHRLVLRPQDQLDLSTWLTWG